MSSKSQSLPICRNTRYCRRNGTVLIVALVCLLVVMSLLGSMLHGSLRASRHGRKLQQVRQTELLLAAGIQRAQYQLSVKNNYQGETWTVPASSLAGNGEAQVLIRVDGEKNVSSQSIYVLAEYPAGREDSIRRSLVFQIPDQVASNQEQ